MIGAKFKKTGHMTLTTPIRDLWGRRIEWRQDPKHFRALRTEKWGPLYVNCFRRL